MIKPELAIYMYVIKSS